MTTHKNALRARIIHANSKDETIDLKDGLLIIDEAGKIEYCGDFEPKLAPKHETQKGKIIIPGLIDCHSHIPQLDERGKHGATLLEWLEKYIFPAERAFANQAIVKDVATRFFKKLILNGTTTASLYSTVHKEATDLCFEIARASGVRTILGKVMMDANSPDGLLEDTNKSLKESEALCQKWHNSCNGRLMYAYTPRFAPTCSINLLKETAKLAKKSGAYLQSHIAETIGENERVRELYPEYKDYVELFERTGCLGEKTILAHAIHLSNNEFERLGRSKTKIAHCPTSNFFLKSGAMPVREVERAGIVFGLGSDVGAGTSMSMFSEMRRADYTQRDFAVTPNEAFYLATLGGAKSLSIDHLTGNFEPKKSADFCVLNICGIDPNYETTDMDTDDILSLLMYRGDSRVIESVWVGGQKLDVDFA